MRTEFVAYLERAGKRETEGGREKEGEGGRGCFLRSGT